VSGLREKIADAIAGAVSQDDRYLEHADAVLRVLAEHGGVKNLKEQISLMVWRSANERAERAEEQAKKAKRWLIDAAGADVTDLLQSLDDCTARAERAERDLADARQQLDQVRMDGQAAQRDLAAILRALGLGDHARVISSHYVVVEEVLPAIKHLRQQLDQVRALLERNPSDSIFKAQVRLILDAPARPAGHDETGQ
jgi:chromosome segregation ATPase